MVVLLIHMVRALQVMRRLLSSLAPPMLRVWQMMPAVMVPLVMLMVRVLQAMH